MRIIDVALIKRKISFCGFFFMLALLVQSVLSFDALAREPFQGYIKFMNYDNGLQHVLIRDDFYQGYHTPGSGRSLSQQGCIVLRTRTNPQGGSTQQVQCKVDYVGEHRDERGVLWRHVRMTKPKWVSASQAALNLSKIDAQMYADLSVIIAQYGRNLGWLDGQDPNGPSNDPGRGVSDWNIHNNHGRTASPSSLVGLINSRLATIKASVAPQTYNKMMSELAGKSAHR